MNDLAFLVTGAYGKPVSKLQGAPLRLALPWKYGFKSILRGSALSCDKFATPPNARNNRRPES